MKKIYSLLTFLAVLFFAAQNINAQVSGTVFRDIPLNGTSLNTYGVKDGNELGVGGITVTVYPGGTTTTTAADGTYSIAATGAVRVEFSGWSSYLKPSPDGTGSKTSVQFVTAPASNVNFGLHDPNDYSQNNPNIISPYYVQGQPVVDQSPAIFDIGYDTPGQGLGYVGANDEPVPNWIEKLSNVGAVWGLAYDRLNKRIFASTVLKRHVAIKNGLGYIYAIDPVSESIIGSIDLQGVTPVNGGVAMDMGSVTRTGGPDYELNPNQGSPDIDIDAFPKVAKVGYGDIDYDVSNKKVWGINLKQRRLFSLDVESSNIASIPATLKAWDILSMPGAPTCSGGELRPWGLTIHDGKGYLGLVCDGSISQNDADVRAYVYSFDLNNPSSLTHIIDFSMDYTYATYSTNVQKYHHWLDVWDESKIAHSGSGWRFNQPVLADMEFDKDGNLYLAFLNRFGHQVGYWNHKPLSGNGDLIRTNHQGDLLKVCFDGTSYQIEGSGTCPVNYETSQNTGVSGNGEYFHDRSADGQQESSYGSLAHIKGANDVVNGVTDPHPTNGIDNSDYYDSGGIEHYDLSSGENVAYFVAYRAGPNGDLSKAIGLGDIELLSEAPPIEIGNLVWEDTNGNGIQDGGEPGISGVTVKLYKAGAEISSATTDAQGNYIFSSASGNSTLSHKYGISALVPGMPYEVRVPNISGGNKQAALGVATLTTTDVGEGVDTDKNDSDGSASGDDAVAQVSANEFSSPGANNHSFDFGFIPIPPCTITDAGKTNETCNNGGTGSDPADDYITFDLNPTASNNGATYNVTVNNGGTVTPTSGTYGNATSFQLQNGSATGATYTIILTDVDNPNCTIETTVSQGSCSAECLLQDGGLTGVNCSNTGADDNDGNDYIIFDLNPTGLNLGAAYNVTVSVGTVTLADGSAATFLSYGSVKHFRLQDGSAGGGNVVVTVTDNGGNGCSINVPITDPGSCSTTCAVPYEICPGESFETIVQGTDIDVSTIQWYKSTDGGVIYNPIAPPAGTGQTLTITEVGEYYYTANGLDGCMDSLCCHVVVEAGNCPGCQLLTPGLDDLTCNDNGTPQNAGDDFISFSLDPQGNQTSTGYTVTADNGGIVIPGNGTYGSATNFQMQQGSAEGTLYTITITDNDDPNCVITTTVQLSNCGVTCAITDATVQNVQCNNSNTNGNVNDDFLTFDMTVTGNYTGGTYSVSASSGGITPSSGTYDNVNSFILTPGSAGGGNITITITDANDPNCTATATVIDPGSCSVCDLTVNAGSNQSICSGSCTDLTATASGGSGIYNYSWSTGENSSTINVCPTSTTTYTVTVTDSEGCEETSSVIVNAAPCKFDLALKLTTTQTLPVRPGDIVPFTITVCNQSDITVETLELTDYIPAGFSLADPTWTAGAVGHTGVSASKTFSVANGGLPGAGLIGGQCLEFIINLEVNSHANPNAFTNYAEITDAIDEYGNSEDSDSEPATDSAWELSVGCGDIDDDNMDGHGEGYYDGSQDEDDHDPACVDIFDLALKKVETSTGPYKFGDPVTFTYTIYNQGNIAATNIEVTDYVPSGFEYDPALNGSWTQAGTTTPKTAITTTLNPGENTTVTLVLIAQSTTDQEGGWTNVSEISKAEDLAGHDLSNNDYDSILDDDPDNDAGGKADTPSDDVIDGDGTGAHGDTDPATDEDDADPARVKIYDLALRKTLLTTAPYEYYDNLTFEITVFNQGNEAMTDIEISDYIPSGYTFDGGSNAIWNGSAPTVTTTIAGPLAAGDSTKVQIVLKLVQTDGGEVNWDNYAEISGAKDSNGVVANSWDADSTPGSDAGYERAVKPGDSDDDNIEGHYIPEGTDEDDHDPAGIPVFDLALKKVETSAGPYRYGDQVTFTFTVYNQGNIGASNIEVTDYVPEGFEFRTNLNPGWIYGGPGTALTTIVSDLAPGANTEVTLILILQPTEEVEEGWTNRAEISKADDTEGNDMSGKDIDSDNDSNKYNDVGGTPDTDEDDEVSDDGKDGNDDGITDEDDADPARVKVYDLALRKTVVTPEPYHYYDDITFEITVFNQGNVPLTDIIVVDYLASGYLFDPVKNSDFSLGSATSVEAGISGPLAPGDSAKVEIVLQLLQTTGGEMEWDNYAEISDAQDPEGNHVAGWDADSNPDSDATHERAVKPEDEDDDNIDGHYIPDETDEDDHDPAGIDVLDLAMTKTADAVAPYHYDQIVDFTLTVFNQGNETAHDIEVVDYVPSGFIYLPHLNPEWTQALVDTPKTILPNTLLPGESTTVTIKLQFQYTSDVGGYVNKAEIVNAKDENDDPFEDIDSTPDDDPDNDVGGTPLTPEDDNVSDDGKDGDGDGITDEDDEDPWATEVASIGNYVWYDDNDNGIQDEGQPGDVGVAGVTVILTDCNGQEILRTQTDENGHYDFVNLIPGRYMIVFEDLPEDSEWAKHNQGNDNLDSDADEDGVTICTELEAGEDDPSWDAGILRYSSLGDYVWLDTDGDGVQDSEEDQISGVVVKLLDENGNELETTTTDEQGYYLFDSLHPGTYIVEFDTPTGLTPTDKSQGTNLEKDSDPNPGTGRTDPIVLGANEDRRDIDAGYKCGLELEITPNDTLCEGESKDIEVTVVDGTGLIIYDWSTGEHTPSITVVPTETTVYSVTVTDENGCSGIIKDTIIVEPRAKIGDYVWLDLDRDGVQDFYIDDPDLNEPGINGVTVNLYQASDPNTVFMTQLTHINVDTSGFYEFDVCAGDYFVEFIAPTGQGLIFTQQDQGPDDTLDSDADENTGRTITFHVDPEDIDHTRDAGYYTTASIGDYVWHDIDANGIQDDGEEGIDGVEVTLHRADGSIVGTTTTSNGGKYEFTGLIPDDYYVCFDYSGTNYTQISPKDQGYDDTVDSDVDPVSGCTEIIEILAGENDVRWDMGLYTLASLGDYVWYDRDADGCQDADEEGIEGVTVRLYKDTDSNGVPDGAEIAHTQTDNTGFYEFLELSAGTYVVKFEKPNSNYKVSPKNHNGAEGCDDARDSDGNGIMGYSDPIELSDNEHDPTIDQGYYETARLGDYVWYDKDGDGIQDPDEEGVSGVTVTLYKDTDGDGVPDTPVDTKVTNTGGEAGSYVFDDVEPGVYKICFDADGAYEGFTKTDQGGDDAADSDVDQQSGCTEVIVVESGDDDMTNDAGLIKLAELGDYVWEDKNADGIQDPTELPITNVMVILKDGNGNELDTTYTDGTGLYKFTELLPGDYIVEFRKPNGYNPTGEDTGTDDAKDSDANVITGESHLVTLEAGDSDMTIDAGFYKPASLGDYVWEDKDADGIQDPDEDGINGIVVTLYDENGDPVENTTTGVNPSTGDDGYYEFDDLEPGIYHVCFDKGSYDKISGKDEGSDNGIDSDADEDTGCTEIVVLESGEHDPTLDAGLYNLASLGDYVWLDLNGDGIQDGSEGGINDLIVELYIDEDGDGNPDDATPLKTTISTTNNGTEGYYIFEDLEPGNYIVKFPTVDAYEITKSDEQGDDSKDSDADELTGWSATINLESGEHNPTIDAGYFNAASLGDYVWYDEDGDGIQDASEKCMDSVKIYLYRVIDNAGVLDTAKVDSTWSHAILNPDDITDTLNCGYYEFTRLIPGDYFLVFENPDDTKYQISPKDELFDDSKDTDINEFGNTPTITLAPGEHNPTIDAGFYKGECLEGVVWKDREEGYYEVQPDLTKLYAVPNVHDELDQPYPGLVVELYMDEDEFDPSDDVLVQTTVTDAEGVYNFENIKRGNYYIVVNLPDVFELVNNDIGGDDARDNDFYLSEETGQYRSFTFLIEADNDEECVEDIDAGTKERGQTQPITIVDFDAQWNKGEEVVELLWSSMDEIDMDYFDIERRAEDEEEFVNIGSMDSKGGRFLTKYGLKDPNVEGGMTYHYRLIPVNDNGRRDKVYNASVFIPADKFTVNAYPNPVMDRMYVLISGKRSNDVSIEILDNVGRRVMDKAMIEKSNTTYEKISMNLGDLPQGQYYIKVVSGDRVEIKKLVHVR